MTFVVSGTGDGCCYSESNLESLPVDSLKFLLSDAYNPSNASSGFVALRIDSPSTPWAGGAARSTAAAELRFQFYASDNATLLYESPAILPRSPVFGPDGNTVVAMAAPDYAAFGLPRPSSAAPAANYSSTSTTAALGYLQNDVQGRDVTIWLYSPTATNTTWSLWFSDLASHRANVTGVAPCSYLMNEQGIFSTQVSARRFWVVDCETRDKLAQFANASNAALARYWTLRMSTELALHTLPLIAASGSGMNRVLADPTGRLGKGRRNLRDRASHELDGATLQTPFHMHAAFITAALSEALAIGASGFNVQLEEPGNTSIKAAWVTFLGDWLDAFTANNLSVSIIIGGYCHTRDWMNMDCGDYKVLGEANHPNLGVISEATYTGENDRPIHSRLST